MDRRKQQVIVRDVWAENLEFEFSLIEEAIRFHRLISFDTEFPGTIFQSNLPKNQISCASPDYTYSQLKLNVDSLKIIQLGLTLSDPAGNLPSFGTDSCYIWQFNFSDFDIGKDPYNPDSIKLLSEQGIDFQKNSEKGINSRVFGSRWISSPLMNRFKSSLTWITFHGGYDLGLLIKVLTGGQKLPSSLEWFMKLVQFYFGIRVYDLKQISYNHQIHGGLEKIANSLGVYRVAGNKHEAGSDSLLTLEAFIKFCHIHDFNFHSAWSGKVYGLCYKKSFSAAAHNIHYNQHHHSVILRRLSPAAIYGPPIPMNFYRHNVPWPVAPPVQFV